MSKFYVNAYNSGDKIYERYIQGGKEHIVSKSFSPTLFKVVQEDSKYKDIYGRFVDKVQFDRMSEANQWIRKMQDIGLEALGQENFVSQYISNNYPEVIQYDKKYIRIVNVDIEVTAPEFPKPDLAKYPIDAITHYDSIQDKFFVFDLLNSNNISVSEWDKKLASKSKSEGGDEVPVDILDRVVYYSFTEEREMLSEYVNFWSNNYPVILTGWNTETFDIPYIVNRIQLVLGESYVKLLSPYGKVSEKIIRDPYGDKTSYNIAGVESLDYMVLYKKFSFTSQPTYALEYIAQAETGIGKLEYDGPIHKLREDNHQRYISYNIIDVNSVKKIDEVRGFIDLALSIAYYAKVNYEDILSPIKTWDNIIFNSLKHSNIVIPEKKHYKKQSYPGAFVKEPEPRAYKYGMSVDETSMYPLIAVQCNISPETIVGTFEPAELEDYINGTAPKESEEYAYTPNGILYTKDKPGIIPIEIEKIFFQRKEHKGYMLAAERNAEVIKNLIKG